MLCEQLKEVSASFTLLAQYLIILCAHTSFPHIVLLLCLVVINRACSQYAWTRLHWKSANTA